MKPVYADDLVDNVPEGWSVRPFEELVYFQEGPGIRNWQYVEEGVPFVNIRCLVDGRLDRLAMTHVAKEEAFGKYRHFLLDVDDYVVSSSGTLGRIAIVQKSDMPCMLNTSVIRMRPKTEQLDRGYLKYFLLSEYYQAQILSFATGSAQLNYGPIHLRQMFIVWPPLPEQRAIAHILGTLDDKIDLHWRMNETLEAMARALFKSWFVDFGPIRAKAEGRDSGLPKPLANIFPSGFVDSEVGEIPEGWAVGSILEQAELLSGGTPKTDRRDYWDGGVAWATAKDVSQCAQGFLVTTERTITQKGLAESATQVVPRFSTVIVARGATTGRMVMLGREMAMNQTCYALASKSKTPFVLHCQLRQKIDDLVHAAHGSVFDTITTSTFKSAHFILPPPAVLAGFEKLASPLFRRILANCEESQALAELRDTLLPKLISGELRVKDTGEILLAT